MAIDGLTGAPVSSFHRVDLFLPQSDTVMIEHDLDVKAGGAEVEGRRRVKTRDGIVKIIPVDVRIPPGTVLSDFGILAAHVTHLAPGDSLSARAYSEYGDSLMTLTLVAEAPQTITVPAGTFAVMPLRSSSLRLFVTRAAPWRVVKGESLDAVFSFELAGTGPVSHSGH